ncbi:MAG: beta-phosphoglucomutase family hydrolase [Endomicrobiales bacterium]|nr:beta-phosphoglucomutase family hydrolase [Endomicrobiales bacterium]
MLKACIFDLDGVIVDTVPLHFKAWKRMFNEYGKKFEFEDYKEKVDGIPRMKGARAILTDISDEELEKASQKKQGYYLESLDSSEIPIFQTTLKLIDEIKKDGLKLAVVSSSKNCPYILDKIGLTPIVDVIISGLDLKKGKPDPEIFLSAAERLGVKPSESIVFEDALLGVEAAKNGNIFCIGIDRHNDPDTLKKADYIVKDLGELNLAKIKELFEK